MTSNKYTMKENVAMTEDVDVFVDAVAEQLLALWHHLDPDNDDAIF